MHATRSNPLFQDLTHAVIGLILGAACALIGLLAAASGAHAAGLMSPSDGSLPALAIKHHQVRVVIRRPAALEISWSISGPWRCRATA